MLTRYSKIGSMVNTRPAKDQRVDIVIVSMRVLAFSSKHYSDYGKEEKPHRDTSMVACLFFCHQSLSAVVLEVTAV